MQNLNETGGSGRKSIIDYIDRVFSPNENYKKLEKEVGKVLASGVGKKVFTRTPAANEKTPAKKRGRPAKAKANAGKKVGRKSNIKPKKAAQRIAQKISPAKRGRKNKVAPAAPTAPVQESATWNFNPAYQQYLQG